MSLETSQYIASRRFPSAAVRRATFANGSNTAPRALIRPTSMISQLNHHSSESSRQKVDQMSQPEPGSPMFQRWMIAREIRDTEERYLNSLKAFQENYVTKLEEKGLLKQEEKVTYFGGLEELISAHAIFLAELTSMLEKWDHDCSSIGMIFKQQSSWFVPLASFAPKIPEARHFIESQSTQLAQFRQAIEEIYRGIKNQAFSYDSLLIAPIQRVLRYSLLLEQLQKCTPETHFDRFYIDIAVKFMKSFAEKINSDMSDVGCRVTLSRLVEKMCFSKLKVTASNSSQKQANVSIGERLIDWDAPESIRVRKGSSKAKSIKNPLMILTDDAMVICSAKKPIKHKTKSFGLPNDSLRVKHVWRLMLLEATSESDGKKITLVITPGTAGMTGLMEFSNQTSLQGWLKNIESAKVSKHGDDTKFMDIISSWRDFEAESASEMSSREPEPLQSFSPLRSSTASMRDSLQSESSRLSTSSVSSVSASLPAPFDTDSMAGSEIDSISYSEQSLCEQELDPQGYRISFHEEIAFKSTQMRAKRSATFTTLRRSHPL